MKSRFSFWAYFLAFYTFLFTCFLLACIVFDISFNTILPAFFYVIITIFVAFAWIWLVFGELRNKVIIVDVGYDHLTVKRYIGIASATTYYFNQLDGFKTSILPSRSTEYEYLYIMLGDKKIAKLSQFYHKNYADVKETLISANIKDLGYEKYSANRELKEIFIKN